MKLRLTQPGFETYTGQMGVIFFENGLSTNDVREVDVVRMSAVMRCEREDGSSGSVTQSLLDNAHTPAPVFAEGAAQHDADASAAAEKAGVVHQATSGDKPATSEWTEEQLAAVADAKGIKGLREISDPMGIKGNAIKELIAAILKQQTPAA